MSKFIATIVTLAGVGVILGIAVIYLTMSYAYVADVYWDWFILSTWPALPNLTTLQFVAVMAMRSVLLPSGKGIDELDEKYKDKDAGTKKAIYLVIAPWFVLFIGWIIKIVLF